MCHLCSAELFIGRFASVKMALETSQILWSDA